MKILSLFYIVLMLAGCKNEKHPVVKHSKLVNFALHTVFKGEKWVVLYKGKEIFSEKIIVDTGYYNRRFTYIPSDTSKADTLTVVSTIKDSVLVFGKLLITRPYDSIEIAVSMPFPSELNPYDSTVDLFSEQFKSGRLNLYNSRRLIKVYPVTKAKVIYYKYP
jgi:hypothetical protein